MEKPLSFDATVGAVILGLFAFKGMALILRLIGDAITLAAD